ncbi:MAG: class I SAM-dependent methyltransferase [Chloroflexota bacterium]
MTQNVEQVKDQMRKEWGSAAPAWKKYDDQLQKGTGMVRDRMLDLAELAPGKRVLDVACGTGEPAIPAAERVAPDGFVLATDLAEEMLEVAREMAKERGVPNIEFRVADGEQLPVDDGSFDAVTCRWGIMFMPRPDAFAKEAYRALKPGGRAVMAVWASPQQNRAISLPMAVASRYTEVPPPPPGAPGVFSFADPKRLPDVLSAAGFKDVQLEEIAVTMAEFDNGHDYWSYISEFSGPVRTVLGKLPDEMRQKIAAEVAAEASGGDASKPVKLPGLAMIGHGTK